MDDSQFSPGSTISGIFDPNLKTPDPFQFVYISHPFGAPALTPTTPSEFYESSFEIMDFPTNLPPRLPLSRQRSTINFHCNLMDDLPKCHPNIDTYYRPREQYDIKTTFYPSPLPNDSQFNHHHHNHHQEQRQQQLHHCTGDPHQNNSKSYLQRHILSQEHLGPNLPPPSRKQQHPSLFNCYDERTVPELKYIFETLRNVWKTPVPPGKNSRENKCRKFCCQNMPHKRNGLINCEARSQNNITPITRSNLIRRYSLPEIEIRKFGVIQELDSILRLAEQLRSKYKTNKFQSKQSKEINFIKTEEKSSQTNPVTISENSKTSLKSKEIDSFKPATNSTQPPKYEFSDTGPTYLDLLNNRRDVHATLVKKPETMPEFCNQLSKPNEETSQDSKMLENETIKTNFIKQPSTENDLLQSETKSISTIKDVAATKTLVSKTKDKIISTKKLKTESSVDSDIFVSELLIKNLNEEVHIADTLTKVLTESNDQRTIKPGTLFETPKIEVSTVYVSPEKINEIVNKSSSIDQSDQVFKQTLQLPDLCLSDTFEKLPPLNKNPNFLSNDENKDKSFTEKQKSLSTSTSNSKPEVNNGSRSQNISEISSISFQDTFDTPSFPTKSIEESPIDSLDLDKSPPKKSCPTISNKTASKPSTKSTDHFQRKHPSNVAEIQPIKTNQSKEMASKHRIKSNQQSVAISASSSQPDKQLVLPQRKRLNRPKVNDKNITDSLEQYTIDSKGNPNYQKPSSVTKHQSIRKTRCGNQQTSAAINSRYLRVSASSTTSRHSINQTDKLKKVTIFEAQSNIVTPDNDMGPKRFYQKTEYFDGDKKIDILEIVECLQSPFPGDPKTPGDFYTKLSKIPIPIKKCCRSIQPPFNHPPNLNSCNGMNFKCCSSNIIKPPPIMSAQCNQYKNVKPIADSGKEDRFYREYMLHDALHNKCENFDMRTPNKPIHFPITNNEFRKEEENPKIDSEKCKSSMCKKFNECGGPQTIDNSTKSTNGLDGVSSTNDAYTISIPSTMTAQHGSTPRRKFSSKNKYYPLKTSSKSSHCSSLLHHRSKKLKSLAKYEKRLLSHRKQQHHHHHEIINVKPVECNQSLGPGNFCKNLSNRPGCSFMDDDKINAWRIPSADFYAPPKHSLPICHSENKIKTCHENKPSETLKLPIPQNIDCKVKDKCTPLSKCPTESIMSTTTICEKCRICSCYTSTTFSDRLLYSPTPSVCSVCSQPFTPMYRTPETLNSSSAAGANTCFNANCNQHNSILKKDFGLNDEFGGCKNKACLPLPLPSQRTENACSRGKNNCDCTSGGNRFPKFISNECPPIPEKYCGFMPGSTSNICKTSDQPLERFIPSSCSSLTSSIWKSARSHTTMPCINWKGIMDNKKKPEIKMEPVKLTATTSEDNKNNNSVFTVTVKGPTLEKGTDLKMELCFSNPNTETLKGLNNNDNETDDVSSCSLETIHERMLPEGSSKDICSALKFKTGTETGGNGNDNISSAYHLNLSSILNPKYSSNHSPTKGNKNLSVLGNAIAPEQKPKAPTMTEKDLTGRYRK